MRTQSPAKKVLVIGFVVLAAVLAAVVSKVFAAGEPQTAKPLNFREFYQKVLAYYPKLKQQDVNVNLAIARKLQAVSGYLPSFQAGSSLSHGDEPVFVFGSLLRENNFSQDNFALSRLNTPRPHTTYGASIEGQIPIFDAFQTIYRVRASSLRLEAARQEEKFSRMEAFLIAAEAYLKAAFVDRMLDTVIKVSEHSREDIKQANDLNDKGLILGADFYAAKVISGNIEQLKNKLIREKQAAGILMNILMGEDPLKGFQVELTLNDSPLKAKSFDAWIKEAKDNRQDLLALTKMIQAQSVEVLREKSTLLPRIDAFGETRADTHSLAESGGANYVVGLKAKIDLFDPSHSSRVRIARENLKKLELDRVILLDSIHGELANELARFQSSDDNLPLCRLLLDDSDKAVELIFPLYREGRKSIFEVMEARMAYLSAAGEYYSLLSASRASLSRMLYLSGQLDEEGLNRAVGNIPGDK